MNQKPISRRERPTLSKSQLSRKLRAVTENLAFTWGRTAVCGDDEVAVSVDAIQSDDDAGAETEHLVTVMAGFPPVESVAGLPWTLRDAGTRVICRVGQTDSRGQFWLQNLDAKDYRLQFEGLVYGVSASVSDVFAASLGHTDKVKLRQEFHRDEISAQLRLTAAGQWMLEVTVAPAERGLRPKPLVRFRISDNAQRLLLTGFMGLYEDKESMCGQINIDLLDPTVRARSAGCNIEISSISMDDLGPDDRDMLDQCRSVTEHPFSRTVLEQAIAKLQ